MGMLPARVGTLSKFLNASSGLPATFEALEETEEGTAPDAGTAPNDEVSFEAAGVAVVVGSVEAEAGAETAAATGKNFFAFSM